MTDNTEVRVTSSTGAEKGSKLARFDLIPVGPLTELAEHFGRGAKKYADRNWEAGYDWSLSFAAMQRHAWQFWNGEDIDPETGSKHIIAVAWHALALAQFMDQHPDFDNRVGVKPAKTVDPFQIRFDAALPPIIPSSEMLDRVALQQKYAGR